VFQEERHRLQRADQKLGREGVHDVVRNDFKVRKALVRRHIHELVLSQAYLTRGIAAPAAQSGNHVFQQHLRIPIVRLEKQHLATRLEQTVQDLQILRIQVVAEYCGSNDIVEAFSRQIPKEGGNQDVLYVYQGIGGVEEFLIKDRC
jgi:hypothetical protein